MLGRYALYEKIASGGMASVHIGRLVGPVGFSRTVAIKRMHPQFASDPEFVSMFLDEARLAARIRHPNVVQTIDVVAADGELFLVMDLVIGESLARLVRGARQAGEPIPPALVATIVAGALHGLHAAHEAKSELGEPLGIVHRDVSPQNVLVGTDGVPRIIDFGVAKAVGRLQTTRDGQLKGKLSYMAPEHIRGHVTRLTDVYAASVVLWEALTGKRLFQGDTEGEIFHKVLAGCTEPPSTYAPDVPARLDEVTMRGLQVDPANRFESARAMALAIEEATPLVSTSKLGDWVETVAKDSLGSRSARVATIESDSAARAGKRVEDVPVIVEDIPVIDEGSRSPSTSTLVSPAGPAKRPSRHTSWLVGVSGVALLAGALALGGVLGRGSSAASAQTSAPSAAPSLGATAPIPPAVTAAPSPTEPAATPAPSAVTPPTPPATTARARPDPLPRTVAPRAASVVAPGAAPASQKPNCDPPYFIDSDGHKQYKRECF